MSQMNQLQFSTINHLPCFRFEQIFYTQYHIPTFIQKNVHIVLKSIQSLLRSEFKIHRYNSLQTLQLIVILYSRLNIVRHVNYYFEDSRTF